MSIQFEVSRDEKLLQEYYQIREHCFRNELGLPSFDGSEDEFDRNGVVLVARDGDQCVGGLRLSGRRWAGGDLPLESEGLELGKHFPQLDSQPDLLCQLTRLALLPGYRTLETIRDMIRVAMELAVEQGYGYACCVAGMNRSRLYKRIHSSLGYEYQILDSIPIPAEKGFSGLPHLLSVSKLDRKLADLEAVEVGQMARVA